MSAPAFITMRLGKDSVEDIKAIDGRKPGIQNPPYDLVVVCKQVPRGIAPGAYVLIWLGSDNSKGIQTPWKQGIRCIARIVKIDLGEKHNDDSAICISIGYIFPKPIDKTDLLEGHADAYKSFSEMPLVGLNDYSNQTVREVEHGPKKDMGVLLTACGKASSGSLGDILNVYPDLKELIHDISESEQASMKPRLSKVPAPRNLIYFGAPGTGKSYRLNEKAEEFFLQDNMRRITFHPEYTYAQFVGSFKPYSRVKPQGEDAPISEIEEEISYRFVPGPFLETYVKALQNPDEDFLLIIEELNRANPAAVFGDIFQLLDRGSDGRSEYDIAVPVEMRNFLEVYLPEYATSAHIDNPGDLVVEQMRLRKECSRLRLPSNMYIWATMNSADQGVYPMDTAFKRRWDFNYLGVDEGETVVKDKIVPVGKTNRLAYWNDIRKAINRKLLDVKANEDKLIGPFFLAPRVLDDTENFNSVFKSKVLLYLFEDAAKTKRSSFFKDGSATYSRICEEYDRHGVEGIFGDVTIRYLDDGREGVQADEADGEEKA